MNTQDIKSSLLIPYQLPEYIRDNPDYSKFVAFTQAYYEWLEQNDNVLGHSQNLLNYIDVDRTTDEFLNYYLNEFLPYFPEESLLDKNKAIKVARELYKKKGTTASYQFLFKILYNSDFDIFYTKDAVLRASDGLWYISKSLKLLTYDDNFLKVNNYRLLGESTKTIATIENSIKSGKKTEVFISNIERVFQSGEFVRVVDSNNQDVLFDNKPLRAKIVGQINQIKIDSKNRGLFYKSGDPVVIYNGLSSNTGIGATARVKETTKGSIKRINVLTGGYGYTEDPNTTIDIINGGSAKAIVGSVDPAYGADVTFAPLNIIGLKRFIQLGNSNYHFLNTSISNVNTTLAEAFSFTSFTTYPITSVLVQNGGGGITTLPDVVATSLFKNEIDEPAYLSNLGILAPIQITNGGDGYNVGDKINIVGGTGFGAFAEVTNVNSSGTITGVGYYASNTVVCPLGGMGYKINNLPSLHIESSNISAANAILTIPAILGTGAQFGTIVDRAGSITSIEIINGGEDYISTPNVSVKIQDIVVSNVSVYDLPKKLDLLYQGDNYHNSYYKSYVESITPLQLDAEPSKSTYILRTFENTATPNPGLSIRIKDKEIVLNFANTVPYNNPGFNNNGIKNYGDGTAKATATYLNGLVFGAGQYLNSQGQPSSYSVIESETYNNYTYLITVQKEISKYKNILLNLLHPAGMRMLGRYKLDSTGSISTTNLENFSKGHLLSYYTGNPGSYAYMETDFEDNKSTNIINFAGLSGANVTDFIFTSSEGGIANTWLELSDSNGTKVKSEVINIDNENNKVTIRERIWLTVMDVAYVSGTSGSNEINIVSFTNSYDRINNGRYTDPTYKDNANVKLKDILYSGDFIKINGITMLVDNIDYENGKIYTHNILPDNIYSLMSVRRKFTTSTVKILGQTGLAGYPQLSTENNVIIGTENDLIILIG